MVNKHAFSIRDGSKDVKDSALVEYKCCLCYGKTVLVMHVTAVYVMKQVSSPLDTKSWRERVLKAVAVLEL